MDINYFKETGILRHANFNKHAEELKKDNRTLLDIIKERVQTNPQAKFLGTIHNKKVIYIKNIEAFERMTKIGGFLQEIKVQNQLIGLLSLNRIEWILSEYGGYMAGFGNIPLYSTFHPTNLIYILNQTGLEILFGTSDKIKVLLKSINDRKDNLMLKHIILFDDCNIKELADDFPQYSFYSFEDITNKPSKSKFEESNIDQNDIATICYTSGTTGNPKGVVLTHKNFISHIIGLNVTENKQEYPQIHNEDVYISFLPLSHVFERMMFTFVLAYSGQIAFYSGDPKSLANDFSIIKPTLMSAVPKVLNRIQAKIKDGIDIQHKILRVIFLLALFIKMLFVKQGIHKLFLLDSLIFNKIKKKFGGNLRFIICGGAAVNPETLEFLKATLSCHIVQGYAQTETLGACCLQNLGCTNADSIGYPYLDIECKIVPIENFPDDQGELLIRGSGMMKEYYKNDKITKESFNNGWFKSGDVVKHLDGQLYIIGRAKDLIKTSYGEYIAVEYLEILFVDNLIEDIFITCSKYSDFLLAFVVCREKNKNSEEILQYIENKGMTLVKENKINKYEIPKNVIIVDTPFINLNEGLLLTPSLKKKRNMFNAFFNEEIEKFK